MHARLQRRVTRGKAEHAKRSSGRRGRRGALAVLIGLLVVAAALIVPAGAANASGLVWSVTNYDNDGTTGVYLRNSADINNVNRDAGHFVSYGTQAQLLCYAWGTAVGPYANRIWHDVTILTGPNTGKSGWISDHWMNTPVSTNQPTPGESQCGATPPPPPPPPAPSTAQKAINWATGQLGSAAWNNLCLAFVRQAYTSAGDNIAAQVSVGWGSNTYPQDIWGHFRSGRTGTGTPPAGALVFYLAKSGHSKTYSHVTIATDGSGNTISSSDTFNRAGVHRETLAQHAASGAWNYYVGWWLPN